MKTKHKKDKKSKKGKGKSSKSEPIKATTYDAAQTTDENANHWNAADSNDANTSMDPATRGTVRDRSRYEAENNSYYYGLLESLSNDLVGTTPRLQLEIPGDNENRDNAKAVESAFAKWSKSIGFAEKLRIMEMSRIRDGESFAILINNPKVPEKGLTDVTLDLKIYECDQVQDPNDYGFDPLYNDGIRYDSSGNVISYTFLKQHPGSSYYNLDTVEIPAESVIHWFLPRRAGQFRGMPEMQSALPLFGQLRRFTLATLTAAETAAMIAAIMSSTIPPDSTNADSAVDPELWDRIPLKRGSLLTAPPNSSISQLKAEQPTSTYKEFKGEILNEIGRSGSVPFNVIAGNSSGYNFSSGRLDHVPYHRSIKVKRYRMRERAIDVIFMAFIDEAALIGEIPAKLPPIWEWNWYWNFDGFSSIDPLKEANANRVMLDSGETNLAKIHSANGDDWESMVRQRAREQKLCRELGLIQQPMPALIPDEPEEVPA